MKYSLNQTSSQIKMTDSPAEVFERIEAQELAASLHEAAASTSVRRPLIIDVRDAGTDGGYIRGSINLPKVLYFDIDADVDVLVTKFQDEEQIVFHCLNSGKRGPFCATRFITRMREVLQGRPQPNVKILTGGFRVFGEV